MVDIWVTRKVGGGRAAAKPKMDCGTRAKARNDAKPRLSPSTSGCAETSSVSRMDSYDKGIAEFVETRRCSIAT